MQRLLYMHGTIHRLKISTTVAPETHEYLAGLVERGQAASMAEALDQTVLRVRNADSMELLERDTAAYFRALSDSAAKEESRLEAAVGQLADEINVDE
jgi:H2-forming N5,N10-methylenetetrahydromethanopterin dehydrogenase-like enzyme